MLHDTTIDRLGAVRAELSNLKSLEAKLVETVKRELIANGEAAGEGEWFRATLSVAERVSVNTTAVRTRYAKEKFPELYSSTIVETLRVSARTGEEIAEAA
jgi:hypothetical protein